MAERYAEKRSQFKEQALSGLQKCKILKKGSDNGSFMAFIRTLQVVTTFL
ncbi:hypothetical protein SAMN06265219_108131 [Gracilimonas mengyeensis]|uniref:Uncharacterized protein n=1 Tax=Gracilimonas mengyeensis TaxID=1302730 RepID=A0A521DFP7_9BACT|nr:hypothetical protein SAMN06265219_108131 [Gracilimonas mengyeensis]